MKFASSCIAIVSLINSAFAAVDLKGAAFPASANILSGDFMTGFESGIFLRKSEDQYNEYGCEQGSIKIEEFRKVKEMLPAVKNIVGVMNKDDKELENMLESLVVFVDNLDALIGVFDADYNGGDFCCGLIFGYTGSNLLYKIAEDIITHSLKSDSLKQNTETAKGNKGKK